MRLHESDPDYVLRLLEHPEWIPDELRRVEERRAGRRWRLILAGVSCVVLVVAGFVMDRASFLAIPLVALAFNLGEWRGESRRLAQLQAMLRELREHTAPDTGSPRTA